MVKSWIEHSRKKLIDPKDLPSHVEAIRGQGQTIATLNGSFDLLHAGHLNIIFEASQMADVLIIALNTDHSIRQYKSSLRPIISLEHRLQMMTALEFVNYVTWFDEIDPCNLLSQIKPDVHVNGSEYGAHCIEAKTVQSYGGKLHIFDLIPGLSTSEIIKKIKKLCD